MDNYLDEVQKRRLDDQEAQQKAKAHKELVDATKTSSDDITRVITQQHAKDREAAKQKRPVEVKNFPDLALREDIKTLTTAVDALKSDLKPEQIEWKPLLDALSGVSSKLDQLPKAFPKVPEPVDAVSVTNIEAIREFLQPLIEAVTSLELKNEYKPNISVKSPDVKVDAPDLKPVADEVTRLGSLLTALLTTNQVDIEPLKAAADKTTQAINNLKFPVPNYILPFKDSNGKATQIQLDSSGNLPTAGASTSYVTLIDEETTTDVTYIGKAVPTGSAISTSSPVWQITRIDESSSPATIKYADGDLLFDNTFTSLASKAYN